MRTLSLTPAEAALLDVLLTQTILDTGSNKTAAACRRMLVKLSRRKSSRRPTSNPTPPHKKDASS